MKVKKEIVIKSTGETFGAYYEACKLLKSEGYTTGSMCRDEPIGFANAKQYDYIAKWRNISPAERKLVDGIMTSEDWREGDVKITYYDKTEG